MRPVLNLCFVCLLLFALNGYSQKDSTLVVLENQDAELAYNRGIENFSNKAYQEAIQAFTEAIKFKPDFNKAFFNRGNVYFEMQQYKDAVEDFKKVTELDSNDVQAWYLKGRSNQLLGKQDEAFDDFSKAIDKGSKDAKAYYFRGQIHFLKDNFDGALDDFTNAIAIDNNMQLHTTIEVVHIEKWKNTMKPLPITAKQQL
jgi:tetratricopeptide (TPR) repeat protein